MTPLTQPSSWAALLAQRRGSRQHERLMGPPLPRRFTLAVVWLALFADYVLMCGALPLS